jgi:hypothetical protein
MLTVQCVVARWAYSEIIGATSSIHYTGTPDIEHLRAKRSSGALFADLSATERDSLVRSWRTVRGNLLAYLRFVTHFHEVELTRNQLGALWVFPMASADLCGQFATFEAYMTVSRTDMGDARVETRPYDARGGPLIIGRHTSKYVLIDGYHRAVSFWKSAPTNAAIPAYMPSS